MSNYDPTDTNGQARAKAAADLRNRLAEDRELADLKWLMSSDRGRRIVWRLLDQAGVFRMSFSTDALLLAFNEGNRNAGLRMLVHVHTVCPELYPVMVREAMANLSEDDRHVETHQ